MMQQRSTEQIQLLIRDVVWTNFKMLVSQSMSAVLRQSVFYCQMLNQVFKVSSGTCQQFVQDVIIISNILVFRVSQGSVATYRRRGGSLCECT